MTRKICRLILKLMGWKVVSGVVPAPKAIIIGVPHTSIWDYIVSWLYYTSVGGVAHTVVKKEMFFWPLGCILRKTGAIPVDRTKGGSVLKQIIDEFNRHEVFQLAITPEGTRKLTKNWKAGFHTIARATGAVVYLGFFDWGKKEVGWFDSFELTSDAHADIKRMKAFYRSKDLKGKHPGLYTAID